MRYLDFAASAPMRPEAVEAYSRAARDFWGNASSAHARGRTAKRALSEARELIAACIGVLPEEIVFTGSGSEAANLAIKGHLGARQESKPHDVIYGPTEHHAVTHAIKATNVSADKLPCDKFGRIQTEFLRIPPITALVCAQLVNNEIGTIQPVKEIVQIAREQGAPVFVDAVQALGKIPVSVSDLGCDMAGFSAHKIGGPTGIGALFVKRGTKLAAQIDGGGQERSRRSGTESVALACAFAEAARLATRDLASTSAQHSALAKRLRDGLAAKITGIEFTGDPVNRVPQIVSLIIEDLDASNALILLDQAGVCASGGSACASGAPEPSSVLTACGYLPHESKGAMRFSFGHSSTDEDVDAVLDVLPSICERLRQTASPSVSA